MSLDTPKEPTLNDGRVGRENIRRQQTIYDPSFKKKEYIKQQREKREQNGGYKAHQKDYTCPVCGYTTRELHKLLNGLHSGDPKTCMLRGSKFIRDKEARERVNQYILIHKEDKWVEVLDDRLDKLPQRPTLPKVNHLNSRFDEKAESDVEYEQEEDEEVYEEYNEIEDDTLSASTVSSLNNKTYILKTYTLLLIWKTWTKSAHSG